jgi:hypothetical protein
MELSASAKEFRPCGGTGFDIKDHDFPVIGSEKRVGDHEHSWFHEESLTPILKRNIEGLREGFRVETESLASKLKDSQENLKEVEDRNSRLVWIKERSKERIEEHKSKIVSLEGTIKSHAEKGEEVESDLKYYRTRLERADSDLRAALITSDQKSHQITDIQTQLSRTEEDLRISNGFGEQQAAINMENHKWIGCTLKLKFIFGEIEKIGALPEDHAEWVMGMVDSIELPPVSVRVRNQFLPSYDDAHMVDVEPEIESERIAQWSREAEIFSDQLGEHLAEQLTQNQASTIKSFITIQKFSRGFIVRRSHQTLYGGNLVEKVASATLIQKIYRGFKGRGVRFYRPRSMHPLWMTTRLNTEVRASRRRGIRFINTGALPFKFAWVRSDGTFSNPTLIVGKTLGGGLAMSTFVSHWFAIYPHVDGEDITSVRGWEEEQSSVRYVRVNYAFTSNGFFDVSTGLSLSRQHWEQRRSLSDGGYLPDTAESLPVERNLPCDCEHCQRHRQIQLDEEDDEARLQLAIQLSIVDMAGDDNDLSPEEMITDDVPDYDIDIMFNNIIQLSPEEMITDDAPDYDIDIMFNNTQ